MAPQCNIDSRGAKLRLFMGIGTLVVAAGLLAAGFLSLVEEDQKGWAIVGGLVLLGLGALGVYEGINHWCVAKAMLAKFFGRDQGGA